MKIVTSHSPKPGPDRSYDWIAVDTETYDGAPDSRTRFEIGYGKSEREAVNDLFDRMDERDEVVVYDDRELRARVWRGVESQP